MIPLLRILPWVFLAALSGCASWQKPSLKLSESLASTDSVESNNKADKQTQSYPNVDLTAPILFGVLSAEVASQRNDIPQAAVTYLRLAQETQDPRLAKRAADLALVAGEFSIASKALSLWVTLDPKAEAPREQLFVLLLREGKLVQNQAFIAKLLEQEPSRASSAFIVMAQMLDKQPDKAAAFQAIQKLAAPYSMLPEAQFAVLAVAVEQKDRAVVKKELDALAVLAPKWDLPVAWLVDRVRQKDPQMAIQLLGQELKRRPEASLTLKLAYPRLLVSDKQYQAAQDAFLGLLKNYPNQPDILYAVGLLSYQLKQLPEAQAYLKRALKVQHTDTDYIYLVLGQIAEEQKENEEAQAWLNKVPRGKYFLPAQLLLANIEAKSGQLDEGIKRLDQLAKVEDQAKEQVKIALTQAYLAKQAGQLEMAYQILSQVLQKWPLSPELLYERALIADAQNRISLAEQDLQAYIKERPNDAQGYNALGYLLVTKTNRYKEALNYLEAADKLDSDNPMIQDSLGWLFYKLGQPEKALIYLQKAYQQYPDPEIAAHLGMVLWQLGKKDQAKQIWQQEAQKHPNHVLLKTTIQKYQSL